MCANIRSNRFDATGVKRGIGLWAIRNTTTRWRNPATGSARPDRAWDPAPLPDAADRLPAMRTAQRIRWHNAHNEKRALVTHSEANAELLQAVRVALGR